MMIADRRFHLLGLLVFATPFLLPGVTLSTQQLVLATGFGFVIGILSGGLGMGGVWLMVPSMTFLFGTGIKTAIGTALTAQVLITLFGSYEHLREKAVGQRVAKPLIVGGILGTPIGVWLNTQAPPALLEWAYGTLLFLVGLKMLWEMEKEDGGASKTSGRDLAHDVVGSPVDTVESILASGVEHVGRIGEAVEERVPEHIENDYHGKTYRVDTVTMLAAGAVFGLVNGLLGTSTTIMVPFLDVVMRLDVHVATAVSLLNVTAISVPASLNHLVVGNVNVDLAAFVAGAGVIGALIGSRVNERAPQRLIQYVMLFLIAVMAYYMLPLRVV